MLSRSALGRQTQRAVRQQWQQPAASRRGFAAPASGSFSYETGTATGIKYAARDMPGATSQLAIVAQAGTRYETMPGLTVGLQTFAFKVRRYTHTQEQPSLTMTTAHRQTFSSSHPARV